MMSVCKSGPWNSSLQNWLKSFFIILKVFLPSHQEIGEGMTVNHNTLFQYTTINIAQGIRRKHILTDDKITRSGNRFYSPSTCARLLPV